MADILLPGPRGTYKRLKDMGDGTHAEVVATASGNPETIVVDTYADAVAQAVGSDPKVFLVTASEINSGQQTMYTYDGAGNIFWVASVKVN